MGRFYRPFGGQQSFQRLKSFTARKCPQIYDNSVFPPAELDQSQLATIRVELGCFGVKTDDRLGRWRLPRDLTAGDVIVWCDAGAYHLPWETRFSHGLCAVVWFDHDERMTVARSREQVTTGVLA